MKKLCIFYLLISISYLGIAQTKTIDELTKNTVLKEGFFDFYYNDNQGKVLLFVKNLNSEFLYYPSLAHGIGSNDIGLDRGRLSSERIVKFEKHGSKLLLIESNYKFRALSNDPLEKAAVKESFASSVLFGFEILGQNDSGFLIDLSQFLLTDAVEAIEDISNSKQGSYSLDLSRSAIYEPMCKSFPDNTEFQTIITLKGNNAGKYLSEVAPNTNYISMHQHHSFVRLPDDNFKMREFDPRIGYGGIDFYDFATAINKPIVKKYISRHRLYKKDPNAVVSEPVKPIVYYMDRGAPEPIRSALMEGASWWNQAFEAAGYKNAFQIKLMPEDADPMDIRYNLIQWVHRSTRGWSYGSSIIDPRSGEIIKGKVTLGSLRVRQDYLIAQGLAGNFDTGNDDELLKMSIDRLKQLAAHEVGHTLGLPHNYISSTNGRASVMDYPHPLVSLNNNKIDFSGSYTMEIGEYDKASIQWGYLDMRDAKAESLELERIVQNTMKRGLIFLTDQDARPLGSVHPQTHLWDNGSNATEELLRVSKIRNFALNQMAEKSIPNKVPLATLEEVLVPMYMFHRYQVQAASKAIGGLYYYNALKGDNLPIVSQVEPAQQRRAFQEVLNTLEPSFLSLPVGLLKLIPPRPFRYDMNPRETFTRRTGMGFDALAPAEASVQLSLELLLNPERLSRLSQQKILDPNQFSTIEMLSKMNSNLWKNQMVFSNSSDYYTLLKRLTATMYLQGLLKVSTNKKLSVEAKSNVLGAINQIRETVNKETSVGNGFAAYVKKLLFVFDENPTIDTTEHFNIAPDGQPIDQDYDWLGVDCNK
jgi:hypothetical protein